MCGFSSPKCRHHAPCGFLLSDLLGMGCASFYVCEYVCTDEMDDEAREDASETEGGKYSMDGKGSRGEGEIGGQGGMDEIVGRTELRHDRKG